MVLLKPKPSFVLLLLRLVLLRTPNAECRNLVSSCLWLPPAARLALQQDKGLQRDCQNFIRRTSGDSLGVSWEPLAVEGYQVANVLFDKIALGPPLQKDSNSAIVNKDERTSSTTNGVVVCFPRCLDHITQRLQLLVDVINANCEQLGYVRATCLLWPKSPCTMMKLSWDPHQSRSKYNAERLGVSQTVAIESTIIKTRDWVDHTLCRLRFCPYTASMERAAVGLETVNVSEGPIGIRHSLSAIGKVANVSDGNLEGEADVRENAVEIPAAALLVSAFWKGVCEMATLPENDVATLLIIAPPCYDQDFRAFCGVCDNLIEPSVQAVRAQDLVGRAWFHPQYEAALVGHSIILPGHALPAAMVQTFVQIHYPPDQTKALSTMPDALDLPTIAKANDMVRWTPHATINLLRRNQLSAAKQVEAILPNPRPNYVYARNVVRIVQESLSANAKKGTIQ